MRRPGEERGNGARGRERRRHRGGARVTWDVIRGPQDLIMGRRMEDWSGSEGNGSRDVPEGIGALPRSCTEEDTYWARGHSKSFPQEVASGSQIMGTGAWRQQEGISTQQQCEDARGTGAWRQEQGITTQQQCEDARGMGTGAWRQEQGITTQQQCEDARGMGTGAWRQEEGITAQQQCEDARGLGTGGWIQEEGVSSQQQCEDARGMGTGAWRQEEGINTQQQCEDARGMGTGAWRQEEGVSQQQCEDGGMGTGACRKAEGIGVQQQCEDARGMDGVHDRVAVATGGNRDAQVLQKRKKKSKEKKRGKANGSSGFQDLYRGQSLEEETDTRENSQCELSSSSAEATDMGTSQGDYRQEINGNSGPLIGNQGRGFKEGLGVAKSNSDEVSKTSPQSNRGYRDVVRSPGNGSSGSGEGLEMEQDNNRSEGEWNGEMEEKNCNPIHHQHLQLVPQNCPSLAHQVVSAGQSTLDCGTVKETGTWCWCLQLYLGDREGSPQVVPSESPDEGQSREYGYSMSSTLRVGENLRDGSSCENQGDIPEPLTKKGGKMGETPELQEWVNWWQGWAGSCRAGSGRRRGSAQAWGCRGEAREGQKQQDVWVLREWTRREGEKRGENGPRGSGNEVWVLRNQEEGKQDSAWPLGSEDVWVPREPRRHRSAYFMADNTKWTPRSAKNGVSDKENQIL
ncbi:peptidyl-prolyl cis-trans isomerase FKBP2 isoform X1 [Engystomops pustulosus]|uniref:peptidyl-prolyl cis-trans isomerase FKBP2 isoform X1 n=1 Tax=Engystomops pustulosus TaxID=76066 RepID=UPI003AFA8CCC